MHHVFSTLMGRYNNSYFIGLPFPINKYPLHDVILTIGLY